ncbi:hypothetical protein KHQ08_00170 (plasmid) [Pseudochrobactrum algeriensis]|nr:hypothetical protein KHQ08_00170 [Pseudochrobactrum algeriensis]QVQ41967.1 hypothetical protein KHQ07_18015 [Pseudochrobactrum algeriensis]QVQ42582.1 hypothetical protein KHQ09_00835 [Pseudochrobactrum algeriensis]
MGALWLQLATYLGLPPWANFVAIPLSGGLIYAIVHWIFNKWCWKLFFRFVGLPDIGGKWQCVGQSFRDEGRPPHEWTAEITITQSWEKIRVYLRTDQSTSSSVSAALIPQGDGRWLLMYSFRNQPRAGEQINPHLGYCEMSFEAGYKKADGDYFTALGRATCGRMTLTRGV